jgi:AcrR family transcriptional regulator
MGDQKIVNSGGAARAEPARKSVRRRSGETAASILDETRSIIAEHGVDGLRLALVGERLGITTPAIYAHYPRGRSELVERVAIQAIDGMIELFPTSPDKTPLEAILDGVSGLVRYFAENTAFVRLLLLDFSSPEGHPSITKHFGKPGELSTSGILRPMYNRVGAMIDAMAANGQGRHVPAKVFFNIVLGATCLNIIYSPAPKGRASVNEVDAIVRELAAAYLRV